MIWVLIQSVTRANCSLELFYARYNKNNSRNNKKKPADDILSTLDSDNNILTDQGKVRVCACVHVCGARMRGVRVCVMCACGARRVCDVHVWCACITY